MSYAWEIKGRGDKWELCRWAAPDVAQLRQGGKPSPEARIVRVRIVRVGKAKP